MKPIQPSLAKLTPPRLPKVVERTRLYKRLDQARKERPIIWITGPPGMGKTTLITSYLRARKLKPLWYQIDQGDADLATFFHYLGLACKHIAPRYKQPLPHLTPEYLPGLPVFTRRFFETLYSRLKSPSILIFDNYHDMPADGPIHDMLVIGLEALPPHVTVAIVSRENPPPAFARLQAAQLLEHMRQEELRLTPNETSGIVSLRKWEKKSKPTTEAIEQLHAKLDGWVAGVVLVLEQSKSEDQLTKLLQSDTPQVLFEYLATQVFNRLEPDVQDFLYRTALLPFMTGVMAQTLTGKETAEGILNDLYQRRYFTERRQDVEPVYQYHPLFREFLTLKGKATFSPDALRNIQHQAALILEDAGQFEEALSLLHQAENFEEATRLICLRAPAVLAEGRFHSLEQWIQRIPQTMVEQTPWLQVWWASCRLPVAPEEAQQQFEQAFHRFQEQGDSLGSLIAWCGVVESILWFNQDYLELDPWMEMLPTLMPENEIFPSPEIEARVVCDMFMALVFRRPQDPAIHDWVDRSILLLESIPDLNQRANVGFHIATHYFWRGEMQRASSILDLLHRIIPIASAPPVAQVMLHLTETQDYWLKGEVASALDANRKGLHLAKEVGLVYGEMLLLALGVYAHMQAENFSAIESHLQEMKSKGVEQAKGFIRAFYHHLTAFVAFTRGDFVRAQEQNEISIQHIGKGVMPIPETTNNFIAARIHTKIGYFHQAHQALAAAKATTEAMKSDLFRLECLYVEATLALAQGKEERGLQYLKDALGIAQRQGIFLQFWECREEQVGLFALALEHDIEVSYVVDHIKKKNIRPIEPRLAPDRWPWSIKVSTLGKFAIELDGVPIEVGRKVPKRVLGVLKAIIAFGGQDVPDIQVMDALWPEAEGDQAARACTINIHRLRKLLGDDKTVIVKDGKISLDPYRVWVDAWAFEHLLKDADVARQQGNTKKRFQLCERAVKLYPGVFLPDDEAEPWTSPCRERLRKHYRMTLEPLCAAWCHDGRNTDARLLLEKAMMHEPKAEALSQSLFEE